MTELTFPQFSAQVQAHFETGTFAEGMALVNQQAGHFPEEAALVNYWRICLAASLGAEELVVTLLERAMEAGVWYSVALLTQHPALQAIQGNANYARLVEIARQMRAVDPTEGLPLLIVRPEGRCGKGEEGCPLLLFLHGNRQNARQHLEHWGPEAERGWLLALPQSDYALWAGAYAWTDPESAGELVKRHYDKLQASYAVDAERVVMAGMGVGGEMALRLALAGEIPARGFIVLDPGEDFSAESDTWEPLIKAARGHDLRGVFWAGEGDEAIRGLAERLEVGGIEMEVYTYTGRREGYPEDFEAGLDKALEFILNRA